MFRAYNGLAPRLWCRIRRHAWVPARNGWRGYCVDCRG